MQGNSQFPCLSLQSLLILFFRLTFHTHAHTHTHAHARTFKFQLRLCAARYGAGMQQVIKRSRLTDHTGLADRSGHEDLGDGAPLPLPSPRVHRSLIPCRALDDWQSCAPRLDPAAPTGDASRLPKARSWLLGLDVSPVDRVGSPQDKLGLWAQSTATGYIRAILRTKENKERKTVKKDRPTDPARDF